MDGRNGLRIRLVLECLVRPQHLSRLVKLLSKEPGSAHKLVAISYDSLLSASCAKRHFYPYILTDRLTKCHVQVFIPGEWSHATLNIEESVGFTQLLSHRATAHGFQMPDDEPDMDQLSMVDPYV